MTLPAGCPAGHPRSGPRWDYDHALRLDDEGHKHAEIAQACGVSKAAVSAMLVRHGRVQRPSQVKYRRRVAG